MDQEEIQKLIDAAPEKLREEILAHLESGQITVETLSGTMELVDAAWIHIHKTIKDIVEEYSPTVGFAGTFCTCMAVSDIIRDEIRKEMDARQQEMFDLTISMMIHRYKGNNSNAKLVAEQIQAILNSEKTQH